MTSIRTRFAPSPTGELHIGGARTALFNFLFARSAGVDGCFILRIDDTDRERSKPEFESWLMEDLHWLGLNWDEGPGAEKNVSGISYRQSERLALYTQYLNRLRELGVVYPCFCSEERLAAARHIQAEQGEAPRYDGCCRLLTADEAEHRIASGEKPCWRFALPDKTIVFKDLIKGDMSFARQTMGDFVVERSDGMPTYLFTSVIDDRLMEITHIIRGEEHIPNTARQEAIFEALGWEAPAYAHIPMILSEDRQKLSKRTGSTSIRTYRERGYLPEAITAHLSSLSWTCPEDSSPFSLTDMASVFSLARVSASSPVHDEMHLLHCQKDGMKRKGGAVIFNELLSIEPRLSEFSSASVAALIADLLDDNPTLLLLKKALSFLFERPEAKTEIRPWMTDLALAVKSLESWGQDGLNGSLRNFMKGQGLKGKDFFHPLRLVLTGTDKGAGIPIILEALGPAETMRRLAGS